MTDRIEPALTAEEWASIQAGNGIPYMTRCSVVDDLRGLDDGDTHAAIAYANHLLPDSDPRKITRERIAAMRNTVTNLSLVDPDGEVVDAFADALASYLPPEP
jgi:hypothetical protein